MEANAHIAGKRRTLLERITGAAHAWSDWCDDFEKLLNERACRPNTVRVRKSQLKRLRQIVPGDRAVDAVTTRDCAIEIEKLIAEGKHRSAQAFRSFLVDCFKRAIAHGHRKDNPAEVLDEVRVRVRRARLTFEVFQALYKATEWPELRNAIALALVSGQARENVAGAQFKDVRDGAWWVERGKTGARLCLPLDDLRLDCFGMSLGEVVRQCRATGVLSKHLIHRSTRLKGAKAGAPIHVNKLTRLFTDELAKLGLDWGDKSPPTLHEVRSLSERLYKAQGGVNTQELLGHKDQKTTALYHDARGEWVKVTVRK